MHHCAWDRVVRSGACFPFASCRQTPCTHALVHKYSLPTSYSPAQAMTDLSLAVFSIPQKAKYPFLKKELTMEGWGCRLLAMHVAVVTALGTSFSRVPVIFGHLCHHLPVHTPSRPAKPTVSFNTLGAALKPGSLLSVRCYSGNLGSALEFHWPGL